MADHRHHSGYHEQRRAQPANPLAEVIQHSVGSHVRPAQATQFSPRQATQSSSPRSVVQGIREIVKDRQRSASNAVPVLPPRTHFSEFPQSRRLHPRNNSESSFRSKGHYEAPNDRHQQRHPDFDSTHAMAEEGVLISSRPEHRPEQKDAISLATLGHYTTISKDKTAGHDRRRSELMVQLGSKRNQSRKDCHELIASKTDKPRVPLSSSLSRTRDSLETAEMGDEGEDSLNRGDARPQKNDIHREDRPQLRPDPSDVYQPHSPSHSFQEVSGTDDVNFDNDTAFL